MTGPAEPVDTRDDRRVDLDKRDRIAEIEARYRRTARQLRAAIVVFAVAAVVGYVKMQDVLERVQDGRRAGLAVSCATTNAIIGAGRASITGGAVGPPEFVRNLERLGFPSTAQREAAARKAANVYSRGITDAVAKASGDDASKVVRPDGTLRCSALQHISQTK